MGWLLELLFELVGGAAADAAIDKAERRLPAWGCWLLTGLIVVPFLLVLFLT